MMGTAPQEEEIPYEREDLTLETQIIFSIYDKLPAKWEGFSGQYLGKELNLLPILAEQYKLSKNELAFAWEIIPVIDSFVAEDISKKMKAKTNIKEPPIGR